MKLSISNIAWAEEQDVVVYEWMKKYGCRGLEIAPTRIFPERPYDRLAEAENWKEGLKRNYGFEVSSMQSIWYGRSERLFGSAEERQILLDYTKKAIDFAAAISCGNLVFGCPRSRALAEGESSRPAAAFFRELGDYATEKGTVLSMEANPPVYNTNYINDTVSALELVKEVDSAGFLMNLDVGTMLQNGESISVLKGCVRYINHVHISEAGLKPIQPRSLHTELFALLEEERYSRYVSIEMGKQEELRVIEKALQYVSEQAGRMV